MLKKTLQILYICLIIVLVIFALSKAPQIITSATESPLLVIYLIFSSLLGYLINSLYLKYSLNVFAYSVSFRDSFSLTLESSILNYVVPLKSGIAMRTVYLSHKYKFSKKLYILITLHGYAVTVLIDTLLFALVVYFLYPTLDISNSLNFQYWNSVLFIICLLLIFGLVKIRRIREAVSDLISHHGLDSKNRKKIWMLSAVTHLALLFLGTISFYLFAMLYGVKLSLSHSFIYQLVEAISFVFNITPSGLGLREVLNGLSSVILGNDPYGVISITIVARFFDIIVVSLVAIIMKIHLKTFKT